MLMFLTTMPLLNSRGPEDEAGATGRYQTRLVEPREDAETQLLRSSAMSRPRSAAHSQTEVYVTLPS